MAGSKDRSDVDSDDAELRDALGMSPLPPRPVLPPGTVLEDVYRIEGELGAGGMGVVYHARDLRLERDVAIKLHVVRAGEQQADRLLREARTMARLVHPNVATVFEVGTWNEHLFVAMELVEGGTARSWLAEEVRMVREIVDLYLAAARGLAAAHDAGIVHRDFKPDNVLVGRDGRVKVADFGLARGIASADEAAAPHAEATAEPATVTRTGAILGTPAYMAPEQRSGATIGPAADQYAFAVALWEALAGARPTFARDSEMQPGGEGTRSADVGAADPPLPAVSARQMPSSVRRVLARALARDPDARFSSMASLATALDRALPRPGARRRRVIAAIAATALLGGGATAAMLLGDDGPTVEEACRDVDAPIHEAWSARRGEQLRTAFTSNGPSFADAAAGRAIARLDMYAAAWSEQRRATCRAERTGIETREHADRRVACLERRRGELDALVTVLSDKPTSTMVDRSVDLVFALPPPEDCHRPERLAGIDTQPHSDAGERHAIEARIAEARALHGSGEFVRGLEVAKDAIARADRVADPRLAAEARYWAANLVAEAGKIADARALHEDAAMRAAAVKDDYLAATIWAALLSLVVVGERDFAAGERYLPVAQAAVVRAGSPPALEGGLASVVGLLRVGEGRHEDAVKEHERALSLLERAYAPGDPRLASYLNRLGNAYGHLDRNDDALAMFERAEKLLIESYGPDHPNVARVRHGRANMLSQRGDHDAAYQLAKEVIASKERLLGREHPELASSLVMMAHELVALGRPTEAQPHIERALGLAEKKYGKEHPVIAFASTVRGDALAASGDRAGALAAYERGLAIQEKKLGPTSTDLAETRFALARLLWDDVKTRARARALVLAARDALAKAGSKKLAEVESWLANAR